MNRIEGKAITGERKKYERKRERKGKEGKAS